MARKGKGGRRRRSRQPKVPPRRATEGEGSAPADGRETAVVGDGSDRSEVLFEQWDSTRQGARSGRGFHFQDAVGAWLGARVASGSLNAAALVPEGFEDMSVEGDLPWHVQVKSRVKHRDRFPPGEVSSYILEAWRKRTERQDERSVLVVVLERGVKGEDALNDFGRTLDVSLPSGSGLRKALRGQARELDMSPDEIDAVSSSTVVVGVTWEQVTAATDAEISDLVSLPPSGLGMVGRDLRVLVADTSDANGSADYENRCRLTRTELVARIQAAAEQIDLESLEFAVTQGVCEPLSLNKPLADMRFYEGTATQPGHLAAGLVVPRPKVMDKVLSGLDERSAVVITGPSGVGKSAVLWTVPQALPGVVWYRIKRLLSDDVPHLVRLARAQRASPEAPVGFLVDGAGTDGIGGWARLRADLDSEPGVLLVATAREEDLVTLGDLTDCATVSVRLSQTAAETIFRGLKRRGVTTMPHWAEAFSESNGLTLEFTHLLTRGRRLGEVIGQQVQRRIVEERYGELEVLRLVSVAHRWSASLPASQLEGACDMEKWELRQAVERLAEEHLVVEQAGVLSGLHRLRSQAISDAVHATPPPDFDSTIRKVLPLIEDRQLHRFIANLLRDVPSARTAVIETASSGNLHLDRLAAYMEGLRLFDFCEVAQEWRDIADRHEVWASVQPFLFAMTVTGMRVADLGILELQPVQDAMQAVRGRSSIHDLVSQIGAGTLAGLLATEQNIANATRMFSVLTNPTPGIVSALNDELRAGCELVETLRTAPVNQLAVCISAARFCAPTLAESLLTEIGGPDETVRRIRTDNPWITQLETRTENAETIAFARVLHVSDDVQGDPDENCVALARVLIRCFPEIDSVDIRAQTPGGHGMHIGDVTRGISKLKRKYDYSESRREWNQARIREAHALLGDTDTNRLDKARLLLKETANLTRQVTTRFLAGGSSHRDREAMQHRIDELRAKGRGLKPPLGSAATTSVHRRDPANPDQSALVVDDLSSLITDLTDSVFPRLRNPAQYPQLAGYISKTVLDRHLKGAIEEPWSVLGMDRHPETLDSLADTLNDLYFIIKHMARQGSDAPNVFQRIRSGTRREALRRAARIGKQQETLHVQTRNHTLAGLCETTGYQTKVMYRSQQRAPLSDFAVHVELDAIIDWPDALLKLGETLSLQRPTDETYLLVPCRLGRPVPRLAKKLGMFLLPSPGLPEWISPSLQPWPSDVADIFDEAQRALQTISGLFHLPEEQQAHPLILQAMKQAETQFLAAQQKLSDLPPEPVIDFLVDLVQLLAYQVQAEVDGTHTGPTFAEQIAAGAFQVRETEEWNYINGALYMALEWEIDPEAAATLLPETEETP